MILGTITHKQHILLAAFNNFNIEKDEENCSYAVNIRTNCSSPPITRDSISLRFGDANGNEILAPNLDGRFWRCSLDSYLLYGPCMNPTICYLFLYRSGNDGWIPLEVIISRPQGIYYYFTFNASLPNNTWFGINNCFPPPPPPANAASLAVKSGNDGWTPMDVIIIKQYGGLGNFFYNVPLPNNSCFGLNYCFGANAASLAVK
ncbi:hypothetical protein CDL12_17725 [Handroanthus impetiginosus]|uniref:Uncharacterized protein n=1 Tax=Handroanthus impetiginosus TaxID=429701 RepID=A0A2G9GWP0_9LAMI|nr:hypothetical protein CDL12_17725 [Handroanthus impetiginosus]